MRLQQMRQGFIVARCGPLPDMFVKFSSVLPTTWHRVKSRLQRPRGIAHHRPEPLPLVIGGYSDGNPAVVSLATIDVVRRLPRMRRAEAWSSDTALYLQDGWRDTRDPGLIHAEIDPCAFPRLAATVQRQQEGVGDIEPAGMIHVVAAGADGLAPFIACQKRQTTDGIHRARSRPVGPPRPSVAVGGAAQRDNVRLHVGQTVVVQAEPQHGAGAEVVGDDIALGDQLQEYLLAAGLSHIQAETLLIPAPIGKGPSLVPPFFAGFPVGERA